MLKYIKLFENYDDNIFYELIDVNLLTHIGGIMWIEVRKNPVISIFGEERITYNKSNIKFKQTNWDEWEPIMTPLGYKLNKDVRGYPFENKKDKKMIFIYDIGDNWYIVSLYDFSNIKQTHYLIDDKPGVIEKINEFV